MRKVIKIFVASSINEFKSERNELGRFVMGINNRYFERDIYCRLELCENEDQAIAETARKQDQYNELIKDADAVFILFFRRAGEYTIEEMKTAREAFLAKGMPKVYVYFKDFDESALSDSVREAYDLITNGYKHFFSTFENVATIELDILRTMFDITSDPSIEVSERGGKIYAGNEEIMSCDELDYIKNSRAISTLKEKIAGLIARDEKYTEELFGDDEINAELESCQKRLKERYDSCYRALEARYRNMRESSKYDPELQAAYNASSKGDYKKVLEILSLEKLNMETKKRFEEEVISHREYLDTTFNKFVQRINALAQTQDTAALFETYESAVDAIRKFHLYETDTSCLKVWYDYTVLLLGEMRADEAIETGEILNSVYKLLEAEGKPALIEHGLLYGILGSAYMPISRTSEAEERFLSAVSFFERADKSDVRNLNGLADSYVALASFYDAHNRPEAEQIYLRAAEMYERAPDAVTPEDKVRFHNMYGAIGHFYNRNEKPKEAEKYYKKSLDVMSDILEKSKDSPMRDLYIGTYITSKINAFVLMIQQNHFTSALEMYDEMKAFLETYKDTNGYSYNGNSALFYLNSGFLFSQTGDYDASESHYLKAIELFTELNEKYNHVFDSGLATAYTNFAYLYHQTYTEENIPKAEEYYKKSLELREALLLKNEEAYINDYLLTSTNLANMYGAIGRNEEGREILLKNLPICERLSEKYPERYKLSLATCYANLVDCYAESDMDKAVYYTEKALDVYEELLADNFEKFYMQYAILAAGFVAINIEGDEITEDAFAYCEMFLENSKKAFEMFSEFDERGTNLPASAFFFAISAFLYASVDESDELFELVDGLIEEFASDPVFASLCASYGVEDIFLEEDGEESDLDEEGLDLDDVSDGEDEDFGEESDTDEEYFDGDDEEFVGDYEGDDEELNDDDDDSDEALIAELIRFSEMFHAGEDAEE